jgi:topoisomerase-4 subunit A
MKEARAAAEILDKPLKDALGERYLAYALSTIMSRSLPDVRDGLKPVHRRLLFAMRQLRLDPATGFKKCARVVGDVIGKYHPHGDVAVYDALVRLAQDFAARYPLVDGQGNFGNIDGDNPAAMRYTEARMTEVAQALLEGIDEDAVDFRSTYDGEEHEPIVLPARFPNLLANGSSGIAVGMATNIPPHNVGELCRALLHLIKFPNAQIGKLVELIPGPDFPTGGVLVESRDAVIEAYKTGRGSFRIRAKWTTEKLGHGQYQIVVTEIPYQIQKSRLIEKVAEMLTNKQLPLLEDIRDESAETVRIVLVPRNRTVDPEVMMSQMFQHTDLETRFGLNMNVLDGGRLPRVMNLREVLAAFLEHRHDVLLRRSKHRQTQIERRMEILGGLLVAYLNLDKVIKIIREEDEPKPKLIKAFKITEVQAEAILNMRLRQLRKLEEIEIRRENEKLAAELAELKRLLRDKDRRWNAISDEIKDIGTRFGDKTPLGKRRTEIGEAPSAVIIPIEAFIEKEPITLLCSDKGWIRAIKGHSDDLSAAKYKEGDKERFVLKAMTTDKLMVLGTNGRVYTVACDKLPGGRGMGEPLRLMIDLGDAGQDVADMFVHVPGRKRVVASDAGRGFIVEEAELLAQTKNGKQVLNLSGDEEAATTAVIGEQDDSLAIIGENRRMIIFKLNELPVMGRGRGVILQRYRDGGLSDMKCFVLKEGLTWLTGERQRTETDLRPWIGKRGQAGRLPPNGFPKSNKFK